MLTAAAAPQATAVTRDGIVRALVREVPVLVTPEAEDGAKVLDPSSPAAAIVATAVAAAVVSSGMSR